jgi:hypothetical protein
MVPQVPLLLLHETSCWCDLSILTFPMQLLQCVRALRAVHTVLLCTHTAAMWLEL